MFQRCDDMHLAYYFSYQDFKGLNQHPDCFLSSKGHHLQGAFYYYNNPTSNRLIVFDHGFGGGHRSYMKEIERLCRAGFLVYAYDHTGCMSSEGQDTGGLSQSLVDLNDCLNHLKSMEALKGYTFAVMGHSWGGYSTINIPALHHDLSHIVVLSGPISIKQSLIQNFNGVLKGYQKDIYAIEKASNPTYIDLDARTSLLNTNAKVLLIYSDDDPVVKKKYHYDVLKEALSHRSNISFILTPNKQHNPNYTKEAIDSLNFYQKELKQKLKKNQLNTEKEKIAFIERFDWNQITQQDESLWTFIIEHLNK